MAPIKYEDDMKNRLEKRTIQPSQKSWATLSQRLDKEEKKSSNKSYWWFGVAASITGLLLISNFFFNTETTKNVNTIIVDQNTDTLKKETPTKLIIAPQNKIIVETKKKPKRNETKNFILKQQIPSNNLAIIKKEDKEKLNLKNKVKTLNISEKINQQNTNLAANKPIEKPKFKTVNAINNEIDVLLAKASKDIALQKTNSKTPPLDYNELLIAVEDDLDESFRDKLLKTVRKGYQTVKESVAERNE